MLIYGEIYDDIFSNTKWIFSPLLKISRHPSSWLPVVFPQGIHIFASHSKKKKGQKLDWPPLRSEPSTIGQAPTKQSSEGTGQMHVAWALPETKKYNDPTENKF